jgi:hypothetical protein
MHVTAPVYILMRLATFLPLIFLRLTRNIPPFTNDLHNQQTINMPLNAAKSGYSPLHPFYYAVDVGTRGYWIQSHILRIPDRYGFFSPSPPRLQRHEAITFIVFFLVTMFSSFYWTLLLIGLQKIPDHLPLWRLALAIAVLMVCMWAAVWAMNCFDHRRAPGYKWEDSKLRKE